ncbi:MAG TPA: LysM domain-containing protein [Candidatus Limnocylindrales bacterium]|jgi:nucleoid-associated protein YgaU|nr:LysM domain-containing protein [Candidatus Limnocylindrales bacterium]
MYRRRAPAGRQEGIILGSGRAQQLRRPTRRRIYRPIREYRLAETAADPAPAAVVGLLGLALLVVLFATGSLGRGQPGGAVEGATPTLSPSASPSVEATPTPSPTPTATPSPTPAPTSRVHVVQRGENLTRIAKQYGVTVAEIVEANHLDHPSQISVGQELIIPPPD